MEEMFARQWLSMGGESIATIKNARLFVCGCGGNGAMYSVLVLGTVMLLDAFGVHVPHWMSPLATIIVIGGFFLKSKKVLAQEIKVG